MWAADWEKNGCSFVVENNFLKIFEILKYFFNSSNAGRRNTIVGPQADRGPRV